MGPRPPHRVASLCVALALLLSCTALPTKTISCGECIAAVTTFNGLFNSTITLVRSLH